MTRMDYSQDRRGERDFDRDREDYRSRRGGRTDRDDEDGQGGFREFRDRDRDYGSGRFGVRDQNDRWESDTDRRYGDYGRGSRGSGGDTGGYGGRERSGSDRYDDDHYRSLRQRHMDQFDCQEADHKKP